MHRDLSPEQRQRIRDLARLAHERELAGELAELEAEFATWRGGALASLELWERIAEFQQGRGRELERLYQAESIFPLRTAVASAIARGIVTEEEAGVCVMWELGRLVKWFRRFDAEESSD